MGKILMMMLFLAIWIVIMRIVLPRMGVPT